MVGYEREVKGVDSSWFKAAKGRRWSSGNGLHETVDFLLPPSVEGKPGETGSGQVP